MNNVETHSWAVLESCAGLTARIDDAGCPPLSEGDLRRMFPGSALTDRRLDRLRSWLRVVITHEERLVKGLLGRIRDVRAGPDGYIYVVTDEAEGVLARLEPM